MAEKIFPLSKVRSQQLALQFETPFYLYDERGIRENIQRFHKAFSILPGFSHYFAVKALPNPYILKIIAKEGCGLLCSSMAELILAERANLKDEKIIFNTNNAEEKEFVYGNLRGNILNIDDINYLKLLEDIAGNMPDLVSLRYNSLKDDSVDYNSLNPKKNSKFGLTKDEIFQGITLALENGVPRFAIHSNQQDTIVHKNVKDSFDYYVKNAKELFSLAKEIKEKLGVSLEIINLGGGLEIPYNLEDEELNLDKVAQEILKLYEDILKPCGLENIKIFSECSRIITGNRGFLVSKVLHCKNSINNTIGIDATLADFPPCIFPDNHQYVSVIGKNPVVNKDLSNCKLYTITGSTSDEMEIFARARPLPIVQKDDLLVFHDVGAYCRSFSGNFNGKLRCGELLLRQDNSVLEIRRKENLEDYFSTLDFISLRTFS